MRLLRFIFETQNSKEAESYSHFPIRYKIIIHLPTVGLKKN